MADDKGKGKDKGKGNGGDKLDKQFRDKQICMRPKTKVAATPASQALTPSPLRWYSGAITSWM